MLGTLPYLKVVPYYLASHAFWFPSISRARRSGWCRLRRWRAGCPVINAAIPYSGVSWVSRHGESGLTVPIDDPEAFAVAANRLLNEPGLCGTLAEGCATPRLSSSTKGSWPANDRCLPACDRRRDDSPLGENAALVAVSTGARRP